MSALSVSGSVSAVLAVRCFSINTPIIRRSISDKGSHFGGGGAGIVSGLFGSDGGFTCDPCGLGTPEVASADMTTAPGERAVLKSSVEVVARFVFQAISRRSRQPQPRISTAQ